MRNTKMLTTSAVLSALWGGMDGSVLSPNFPRQTQSLPIPRRGRSGVAAAKRVAKKRGNIKARAKK